MSARGSRRLGRIVGGTLWAVLAGSAWWLVAGWPDPQAALRFLQGGSSVTVEEADAALGLIAWVGVAMAALYVVVTLGRGVADTVVARRRSVRAGYVVLCLGLCVLAAGLVRRQGMSGLSCCGTLTEARHAIAGR